MQRALDAVRARRHVTPTVTEVKPALTTARKVPVKQPMPALDLSDLEDVVEDEEATAPPPAAFGQQKGEKAAASGEPCPPMKSLVERRKGQAGAHAPTRRAAQDGLV